MGLEVTQDRGNYITILNGKFCQRVSPDTEGAQMRVNKNNKTVYERFYGAFTGKLINIKTQDGTYGKSWLFTFQDAEDFYTLQLPYSNSYATAFLKILPNVDLTKEMKLQPDLKEVDGKIRSALFVTQDGNTLKHYYTQEHPNGLPDMVKIVRRGQEEWDDTARLEFLENMVKTTILPNLPKTDQTENSGESTSPESNGPAVTLDDMENINDVDEESPF